MIFIPFDQGELNLDWTGITATIEQGHLRPRASIGDTFHYRGSDTILVRSACIDGMGSLVKTATIFPHNSAMGQHKVNGIATLFSDRTGCVEANLDFRLLTKWKTAGDSLLGAKYLARPNSRNITILGAGVIGRVMRQAYQAAYPDARFTVWNRSPERALALVQEFENTVYQPDIQAAIAGADIITSATMSPTPLFDGTWLEPGQHVDLIGAYRPDMREVDDSALRRARVFVDSRDSTIDHIGEIRDPLARGVLKRSDIIADFYDIASGAFSRQNADEITLFKNGGGAHLDLMASRYILDCWNTK